MKIGEAVGPVRLAHLASWGKHRKFCVFVETEQGLASVDVPSEDVLRSPQKIDELAYLAIKAAKAAERRVLQGVFGIDARWFEASAHEELREEREAVAMQIFRELQRLSDAL